MSEHYKISLNPMTGAYSLKRMIDGAEIAIDPRMSAARMVESTIVYINQLRSLSYNGLADDVFNAWAVSLFMPYDRGFEND